MPTLRQRVLELLGQRDAPTDREITDALFRPGAPPQPVNQVCRALANQGVITRRVRPDGRIGNFLVVQTASKPDQNDVPVVSDADPMSEDMIKLHLQQWLAAQGWQTHIAWGKARGADIEAAKEGRKWVIEVKGGGSRNPMRVNYFLAILGETLQRMNEPETKYSIALPDLQQFRNLWARLPQLAKSRSTITAIFVDRFGNLEESGVE